MFWTILGIFVLIAGLLDSWKYRLLTSKIRIHKSSKGQSRLFTNVAIFHKLLLSIWSIFYLHDPVVAIATILALYTSCELWYTIWVYYPFKNRGRFGFKRPNVLYYIYNSLLPNKFAKKL